MGYLSILLLINRYSEAFRVSLYILCYNLVIVKDRFIATLLSSAIGDALGMPLEGVSRSKVLAKFHGPVMDFQDSGSRGLKAGQFTDDTQMMLAIAESIVDKKGVDPEDIGKRFVAWFESGDVRGAGRACTESIERLRKEKSWDKAGKSGEWAAGNGSAMRIAPIALFDYKNYERLKQDVYVTSIITHNNTEAVAGATALAYGIAKNLTLESVDVEDYLLDIISFIDPICESVADKLREVNTLIFDQTPIHVALLEIGTSAYVVESVSAAFYIFCRSPENLERIISEAASAGGDNDTIACMAGGLAGALNGLDSIPRRWLEGLEARNHIANLASDIFDLVDGG